MQCKYLSAPNSSIHALILHPFPNFSSTAIASIHLHSTKKLLSHPSYTDSDLADSIANNNLWAHAQACAYLITVCLPALGPLFTGSTSLRSILRPSIISRGPRDRTGGNGSNGLVARSENNSLQALAPIKERHGPYSSVGGRYM